MTKMNRRSVLRMAGAAGAMMAAPAVLRAQGAYPTQPINVVVPFDTGGYNDRLARAYAPFLQEALGQPLVIVNRGGAGALLGHTYFMQQPDDGHTILCTSSAPYLPLNTLIQGAEFEVSDFHMINTPSRDYTMMTTAKDTGITSVEQVVEKLKADAGSLSIGIQPASGDLVNMMLFADANGIDRDGLRFVTYSGGGPARNATAGAVVDIGMVGGQGFLPLSEQVTPLLVFDSEPRDGWDAPTITDIAGPEAEFVAGSQRGWGVHSSMLESHPDRYQTLLEAIETVSKDPAVIENLQAQDLATEWFGPESSNAATERTAKVMAQHVDLLQGS
ncbi:tripartite tricarboxylate transporter substrate binding protein [uncultured Limimaricola sp.]|uniref:tripartite tricarboxylate transporter substrate binding protein n=1 Tax=uncultured Limimaricola sp. TaxID=2211667 RepID=UPI0030FA574B